jgi:integrase
VRSWRCINEIARILRRSDGKLRGRVNTSSLPWSRISADLIYVVRSPARALRQHHTKQAAKRLRGGETWQDHDLVFCTRNGKPLAAGNVRRAFRSITKTAGIGEDWTPRELRHTFVSIMSDNDIPIEKIADLVGHRSTIVTQTVYRHQLRPVIETGATAMNTILNRQKNTGSA